MHLTVDQAAFTAFGGSNPSSPTSFRRRAAAIPDRGTSSVWGSLESPPQGETGGSNPPALITGTCWNGRVPASQTNRGVRSPRSPPSKTSPIKISTNRWHASSRRAPAGASSSGRIPDLQSGRRGFDSPCSPQNIRHHHGIVPGPAGSAGVSHASMSRFDSCGDHHPSACSGVSRNAADAADDGHTDVGLLPEPALPAVPRPRAAGRCDPALHWGCWFGPSPQGRGNAYRAFESLRFGPARNPSHPKGARWREIRMRSGPGVSPALLPPIPPPSWGREGRGCPRFRHGLRCIW